MENLNQRYQSVIPPYILRRIIEKGSEHQRQYARHTLTHVHSLMARNPVAPAYPSQVQAGTVKRAIYDAQNTMTLPGKPVRQEGQAAGTDVAVNEAYDYLGVTYDFYWQVFKRNSLDAKGLPLNGTVHYGADYQNAFWNGEQMVFGDGDGEIFNRFTIAIDVVAHELTHGVTETEANLIYFEQAGALNESLSDVFGSLVKQFHLGQTAGQADWIIGQGLLAAAIKGKGLRSMSMPGSAYDDPVLGKDPQPAAMDGFVKTREDNGGVHINSGIPNRAFYLAAVALGGHAWEKAGAIWYATLCDSQLKQNADFAAFARLTIKHAGERFADAEAQAVENAWREVGVLA
ncbi:M4 family metallopeptidase [Acerihabitans arboris]|uniref:Neutral metalloproteinase n=1 Tax=Acerihabitans arboris TaxID=2691583 RepID=A0A845STD6_9GAMM|nr:M4 family metallopeptidase [Acerihabitans arboris]NDL65751.1 peptidase M4 family protein [Acerihabitans arboris]